MDIFFCTVPLMHAMLHGSTAVDARVQEDLTDYLHQQAKQFE